MENLMMLKRVIAQAVAEQRKERERVAAATVPELCPVSRRWLISKIVAKCAQREQARFLADEACDGYRSLRELPDGALLQLHTNIDAERECAEFDATPHGFLRTRSRA